MNLFIYILNIQTGLLTSFLFYSANDDVVAGLRKTFVYFDEEKKERETKGRFKALNKKYIYEYISAGK